MHRQSCKLHIALTLTGVSFATQKKPKHF